MGKGAAAVAVTQGPDTGHVGLQLIVNDDVAALVPSNAGQFKPQVTGIGNTPNGQERVSGQHVRRTVCTFDAGSNATVLLRQQDAFGIQPNLYTFTLQDFAHSLGDIFVFTPDQARSHLYDGDLTSEAAIHLAKFQPNIASADND